MSIATGIKAFLDVFGHSVRGQRQNARRRLGGVPELLLSNICCP
jgi:hypothetical protein